MDKNQIKKMIGQCLMIGFEGYEINNHVKTMIHEYHVSSIILFARNIKDEDQLLSLTTSLQKEAQFAGYERPLLISIDQENGLVNRLSGFNFNLPGAMALGATGNSEYAQIIGEMTASELSRLGLHWNLAPVMDVNTNYKNPGIGTRSFSDDEFSAGKLGASFIHGHQVHGIATTAKHFPGLGAVSTDPHFDLPRIDKTLDQLMRKELIPFQTAIEAGVDAVMSAHVLLPSIEQEAIPATLSKTIMTDLLRDQIGYEGVILSDCLEMDAIKEHYGVAKGAFSAFKAGVDMLIISHTPSEQMTAIDYVTEKVLSDEISIQDFKEKIERINRLKDLFEEKSHTEKSVDMEMLRKIYQNSVTVLKSEMSLDIEKEYICLVPRNENRLIGEEADKNIIQKFKEAVVAKGIQGTIVEYDKKNLDHELKKWSNAGQEIILGLLDHQLSDIDAIINEKLHVISLRSPYVQQQLFEQASTWINTYDCESMPIEVALDALFGDTDVNGKLPVHLNI